MRILLLFLTAVTTLASPHRVWAQPYEYMNDPTTGVLESAQKPSARMAVQHEMVRAIQRGRLRAARNELARLLRYQAYAVYTHRRSLVNKLQTRIDERRAAIRGLTRRAD
jgi:hypothetical protein